MHTPESMKHEHPARPRWLTACGLALALLLPVAQAREEAPQEGVKVDKPSAFTKLVPAEQVEQQANAQFADMKRQAAAKNALAPESHPQVQRLRAIANKIIPFSARFNNRAQSWKWEVNLIGSKQINAFCMPGGKIAFYTGILDQLKLTDDEVAVVMGHEVAHALREHARERMGKGAATQIGVAVLGQLIGGGKYTDLFNAGGNLLSLKFSRDDESEADVVGLELAARAGYNPSAGVTLWQKMSAASKSAPPSWLSTHPAGDDRIKEIERHLPEVMPLYERATLARQ